MRTFELVALVLGAAIVLGVVIIALDSVLVNRSTNTPAQLSTLITTTAEIRALLDSQTVLLDTTCDPVNPVCQVGVSALINGTRKCQVWNEPTGTPCVSQCYVLDTVTNCTAAQTCEAANTAACLGACTIALPTYPMVEPDAPACVGKFIFNNYFTWNTSLSSYDKLQQLFYSNYTTDCHAVYGCRQMANQFTFYLFNSSVQLLEYVSTTTSVLDCLDFLNMTNVECIQARVIPMGDTIANLLYRNIISATSLTPEDYYFQGNVCVYYYKCGVIDEAAYSAPIYLQGKKKRAVAEREETEEDHLTEFIERFKQQKDDMREKLGPAIVEHAQRMHELKEKSLAGLV